MQRIEPINSPPDSLRRFGSVFGLVRSLLSRAASAMSPVTPTANGSESKAEVATALKVAAYALVLMDSDGQVVWTREWDAGGVFSFGPRQRLWVTCGFTNYSEIEAEIAEYEVELMGEDGVVIERFSNSFSDLVVVPPGGSKHFPAEWRM